MAASTVSYVLSGKRSVSAATRRRVERSIELLDYHPHAGRRALASNRSNVIALVVPLRSDLYVPVMMEIAIAVTTTARRFGYDVLLLTNDEGPEGIRRVAVSARADAMILMDVSMADERIAMLRETGIDAVLIGVPADTAGLGCVDLDFATARSCASSTWPGSGTARWRSSARRRRVPAAQRVRRADAARAAGHAAARGIRLVHRPCAAATRRPPGRFPDPEDRPGTAGLMVQNEAVISPLLSVLRTAGRIVPEDMSVVAICPTRWPSAPRRS